jgi:hypothetical protein
MAQHAPLVAVDCAPWDDLRHPSREVHRNGGSDRYRAAWSDRAVWDRTRRPKLCNLACRPFLSRTVSTWLRRQWSPEQIAGWLKRTYRAPFALRDAGRGCEQGHRKRRLGADQAIAATAQRTLPIADLGQR